MSWQTEMVITVRVLTNDFGVPQKNTDAYLETALVAAGLMVSRDLAPYFDAYTFGVSGRMITPDPYDAGDLAAQALFPLKAACILNMGDFQKALGQGIKVRDGDTAIDTSVSFGGYKDIINIGPCAAYESLKDKILQDNVFGENGIGGAIISPHRNINDNPVGEIELLYDGFCGYINDCCRRRC